MSTISFQSISLDEAETCGICLDQMNDESVVVAHQVVINEVVKDIYHTFHEECLKSAVSQSSICPLCRCNIDSINGKTPSEIRNGIMSEKDRGWAVIQAGQMGHLDRVRELLSNHATISEKHRGWATIQASCQGRLDIVRVLLSNNATISEEHRGAAVVQSGENNHFEISKLLLANGKISIIDRTCAIGQAIYNSNLKMAGLLMAPTLSRKSQVALLALGVGALSIYLNQASGESS